jgi:protein-disulfide isomerase
MKIISKSLLAFTTLLFLSSCDSNDISAPRASIGDVGSKVVIEEFSDFQCPACGTVSPEVEKIARENPGLVRLEFHHFPLPYHENAFTAAVAAECANLQGKFWEMGDIMFNNQNSLTTSKLKEFAKSKGIDPVAFDPCLDGNLTAGRVREDLREAKDREVGYTPSFYVNGKLIQYTNKDEFVGYLKSLK